MLPIFNGLLFGLVFLFALGPAFFALIQTSIQQGFRKAIFLALGMSLSDTFYVIVVLLGMNKIFQNQGIEFWMAVFGSVMLVTYATYSWFKKPQLLKDQSDGKEYNYAKNLLKGLFLNGLNPLMIIFWTTWISTITVKFDYDFNESVQFFGGMLITILSMDIGKAFIAHTLKHLITVKFIKRMNRSIAVILLFFTVQIVYFLYQNYL
ncbi:MAG: LysE family transporter [Bacteroidota bacterium]